MKSLKIKTSYSIAIAVIIVAVTAVWYAASQHRPLGDNNPEAPHRIVVDQADRKVRVPGNVSRIVSLWSEATRIIVALGDGDKLAGICHNETRDPVFTKILPSLSRLPELGDADKEIANVEELIVLKPDVIFVYVTSVGLADDIQNKTGIPTLCVSLNIPATEGKLTYDIIKIIGDAIGRGERARFLYDYLEGKLSKVRSVTAAIPEDRKQKGLFIDPDMMVVGFQDPVASAGMVNVGLNLDRWWYQVNFEQLAAWAPDHLFLGFHISHYRSIRDQYEAVIEHPQWKQVKAVQNHRVHVWIDYCWAWYPGLMPIDIMRMAKIAYPEKFKTLDIEKEGNEIFRVLYGKENFFSDLSTQFDPYDVPE